jgi:hypothetical protein
LWHLSDLPTLLTNVGNQGKSGNDSDIVKVSRMTQMRNAGDLGDFLRLSLPFSELRGLQANGDCCLGLILIELSSVAAAIITRMPARLSAICIASPSEMSTSAMWLASASRTPRQ